MRTWMSLWHTRWAVMMTVHGTRMELVRVARAVVMARTTLLLHALRLLGEIRIGVMHQRSSWVNRRHIRSRWALSCLGRCLGL
jgi:hypothetical protein